MCLEKNDLQYITLRKTPKFHLISWSGNFKEKHSSTQFPQQENTVFCAVHVRYPRSFNARSHASVIYKRVHFVILGGGITGDILS